MLRLYETVEMEGLEPSSEKAKRKFFYSLDYFNFNLQS